MEDTILLSFPLALTRVWINPAMHSGEPRAGDTQLMSPCYCCSSGWRKISGQSAWTWLTDTSSNLANLSFASSFCVLFTTLLWKMRRIQETLHLSLKVTKHGCQRVSSPEAVRGWELNCLQRDIGMAWGVGGAHLVKNLFKGPCKNTSPT